MTAAVLLWLALAVLVVALVPWGITYIRLRRRMERLRHENSRLQGEIEARLRVVQEKEALARQLRGDPTEPRLGAVAGPSDERGSKALPGHDALTRPRATTRDDAAPDTGDLFGPIHAALDRARTRLHRRNDERQASLDAVAAELRSLAESQSRVYAAEAPAAGAPWDTASAGSRGEPGLERIVALAEMGAYCDFVIQGGEQLGEPAHSGDAIVRMPGSRTMAVHTGVPLEAYDEALQASDRRARQRALARLAHDLRTQVAAVAPLGAPGTTADLVVLYVPGEQFLAAAGEADPRLAEAAIDQDVALATPRELIALLKTIKMGWRQQAIADNADQARREGLELWRRVQRLSEALAGTGVYNRAPASNSRAHRDALAYDGRPPTDVHRQPRGCDGGDSDDESPGSPR